VPLSRYALDWHSDPIRTTAPRLPLRDRKPRLLQYDLIRNMILH
jgi:hypothetical protein